MTQGENNGMQEPESELRSQTATDAQMVPQAQQRLLQMDQKLARLHTQIEHLVGDATQAHSQLTALIRHVTDPHTLDGVQERLAELTSQVEAGREQLDALTNQMADLASRQQLAELATSVTKLGRTQFKSNALGESKEEQVERSLKTLQDMLTRREERQDQVGRQHQERFDEARQEARCELAADLLPALDSVELALESGKALVRQQKQAIAVWHESRTALNPQEEMPPASPGLWQKLRSKWAGHSVPARPDACEPPSPSEALTEMPEAVEAWLQGLALVRDRFLSLLSAEGIQEMQALEAPFDPHLHLAVKTETRDDVPPNTVVRVLRKGYRQQHRVLRYAEVVVTRAGTCPEPIRSDSEDPQHA